MSRSRNRVDRIWRASHTFITPQDWQFLADYWKSALDAANAMPEDYEALCLEVRARLSKVERDDTEGFNAIIIDLAENSRAAYLAFMYVNTRELARIFPFGRWVSNNDKQFLAKVTEVRSIAKAKRRSLARGF